MQYLLLIYEDESIYGPNKDNALIRETVGPAHMAFAQSLGPAWVAGAGLKATSSATTLHNVGAQRTLHDGPFAETKEQLGGFYLIDAPDLDAAIAIARKMPLAEGGKVEIRPTMRSM